MGKMIMGKMIIGTIGHLDHGKTTVASAIEKVISEQERGIIILDKKEPETFIITNPYNFERIFSPPMTRKERRALERKNKK